MASYVPPPEPPDNTSVSFKPRRVWRSVRQPRGPGAWPFLQACRFVPGGSRPLLLPVCDCTSPSARGGTKSQLIIPEVYVQRRGPAVGDRAGRWPAATSCSLVCPEPSRPESQVTPGRLVFRREMLCLLPRPSIAGCFPLGDRLEVPQQRCPAQREPCLPLVTGWSQRACGGSSGFTELRGAMSPSAWKYRPFAYFWGCGFLVIQETSRLLNAI